MILIFKEFMILIHFIANAAQAIMKTLIPSYVFNATTPASLAATPVLVTHAKELRAES